MSTFSDIYNATIDQFGDSSTAMVTRVKRFINWSQQDIASRKNWEFLMKRSWFQCTDDYTTGTVTVTNGSTTVTGSGTTFTSGMAGRKFRKGTDEEYYTISAFVSTTEITLDQSYVGTTASAADYSIYQDEVSLASDAEKVTDLTNPNNTTKIQFVSRQDFDTLVTNPRSTGTPSFWIPAGRDSSNNLKIQLYLIPDDDYVIFYWYRKQLTDLSADADTSLIPDKYHKLLYLGAMAQSYEWDNSDQSLNYWTQYENMIEQMAIDLESGSEDSVPVLGSYGAKVRKKILFPPAHFEN